jgi:hypothetical protein
VDADGPGNLGRERQEKIKGYSMSIFYKVNGDFIISVNGITIPLNKKFETYPGNFVNVVEQIIRTEVNKQYPDNYVNIDSLKCTEIYNGVELHDNRIPVTPEPNTTYHFVSSAHLSKYGGRRRSRKTRKSRKNRKSRRR